MSTLTTSPSPASSPHNAFHVKSPRAPFAPPPHSHSHSRSHSNSTSIASGSRHSPHRFPVASRTSHAAGGSSATQQQQPHKQQSLEGGAAPIGGAGYVDAGTQYSPVGSPPTSKGREKVAGAVGQPLGASSIGGVGSGGIRKRKEASTSGDSSPEHMSASSASSGAPQPARTQQPTEPQLRTNPADSSGAATTAPSNALEPQEARSTHGHSAAPKKSKGLPGTDKVMPLKYETASPKDLGVLISNMLMELIRINDQIPLRDGRLTRFHSRAPPGISVSDYLQRLIQHATLSPPILLSMVYYIDRLCTLYPAFTINSLTVHRFLITAATVAAKGLSDSFWTNPTYARIGGIPVTELATLELELLQRVHWRIVPKPEALEEYYASLVDRTDGFIMEASPSGSDMSTDSSETKKEDEDMADDVP